MFDIGKQKNLIQQIINSAVCIDDQLVSPYDDHEEEQDIEKSKELYLAFNRQSKCSLDIYSYKSKKEYDNIKNSLIANKNIVILDWELNENANPKYWDTLTILEDLCDNPNLQFVDIYTQEEDLPQIAYIIYCYFNEHRKRLISTDAKKISEGFYDFIDNLGIEGFDSDKIREIEEKFLQDYLMNPIKRKEIENEIRNYSEDLYNEITEGKDFRKVVCPKFQKLLKEASYSAFSDFLKDYCLYRYSNIDLLPNKELNADAIDPTTVFVNGTVIHITSKGQTEPNQLMEEFASTITNLPMYRSLLLSLYVRHIVNCNMASVGKQIGVLNEKVLLNHFSTLSEEGDPAENISNFITNAITEHLKTSMINDSDLHEFVTILKKPDGEKLSASNKEDILLLNSMLSFIPAKNIQSERHRLMTGDVFEVDKKINDNECSFIMCISKSCDTLRPTKINNNYAFVLGSLCDSKEIIRDAEQNYYTYLDNGKTIKWTEKFMTIHIFTTPFSMKPEERKFKFDYIGGEYQASYLGIQKEIYTIRIMNHVFSNAMKVGIDLPHK